MNKITTIDKQSVWDALQEIKDPEIPAISIVELGIITSVSIENDQAEIIMTPTFVGCPAIKIMQMQIQKRVEKLGFQNVSVIIDFETHWTSDRISDTGRKKLKDFGLAPPKANPEELTMEELAKVSCPFCDSVNTTMNSPFGSTLCRAIHFCWDCNQGFEQFKPVG